MIERIRVTLWDIFTFFLTGLLAASILAALLVAYGPITLTELASTIVAVPASIIIVAAPLILTLLGLVIEPLANYFDRFVLTPCTRRIIKPKAKHADEEEILAEEIRTKYLGSLNGRVQNPYQLCKDYVETKQLSTTFMIFLARYGFYRNCAFLTILTGIAVVALSRSWLWGPAALVSSLVIALIFKRRAEDFYSYLAPTVYRAFLIDKLQWVQRDGA